MDKFSQNTKSQLFKRVANTSLPLLDKIKKSYATLNRIADIKQCATTTIRLGNSLDWTEGLPISRILKLCSSATLVQILSVSLKPLARVSGGNMTYSMDVKRNPAGICLFGVNNGNARKMHNICSKLKIKTPMPSFWCLYC